MRLNGVPSPDAPRSPLLERAIARASPADPAVHWREAAFRLGGGGTPMPAIAPAAWCTEGNGARPASVWLATPLHCEAGMVSVRLPPDGVVPLDQAEAQQLATQFNAEFAGTGRSLVAGPSGRLYCLLDEPLVASTHDPLDVRGHDVGAFQPSGPDGPGLRRLATEIEMWLHGLAWNRQRESAGRAALTGLWLWGGGAPLAALAPLAAWTAGDDALFAAWPAERRFPRRRADGIVVVAAAPGAAGWDEAQSAWLQPALAAVRSGLVASLSLSLGMRRYELGRASAWRWWRRSRPWWECFE